MKITIAVIGLLSISTSWASKEKKNEDPKDKREAPAHVGYPSDGHGSHAYQIQPSSSHEDASAISIGAGYSVGAKPAYSFVGHGLEALPSSGGQTIQLPAITLQPEHGGLVSGGDLSQLMSQLSHGLNSGAISLQSLGGSYHGSSGGQELSLPQYTYGGPKLSQYSVSEPGSSVPSYAAGTKGLGSYATGPVLFNPADSHAAAPALAAFSYGAPSSGHSFGNAGYSLGGHSLGGLSFGGSGHSLEGSGHSLGGVGHSLGASGHSLDGGGHAFGGGGHSLGGGGHSLGASGHSLGGGGHSLGASGHSLGGSGHSLGGSTRVISGHGFGGSGHGLGSSGHSFGGSGHSFGGSGHGGSLGSSYKLGGSYGAPSKSFKPSAFLGASVQSDSSHGLSAYSGYGTPSFGHSFSGSPSHGALSLGSGGHGHVLGGSFGGGSSKYVASAYIPSKSEGFGSSLESVSAFSSNGHLSSPPGTTYGIPTASYGLPASSAHGSSSSPQYYVTSLKQSSPSHSFGEGSSSYRAPASHGASSSHSSGPRYSSHSSPSSRFAPKDAHGAYSETTYNTIKYSEELKPRA